MKRGIMLPPVEIKKESGGNSFSLVGDIPFLNIVPAVILYWDKIHAPIAIRGLIPNYDLAVDSLVALGVAETLNLKSENSFNSHYDPQILISKCSNVIHQLDSRESEVWSIMPIVPEQNSTLAEQTSLYLPRSQSTITSIEVQLKNVLPIPERDVPYEDILNFKNSRKDQIQRLHLELSQVSSRYVDAMDDRKALAMAMKDVNDAISDLQRVYEEKWSTRLKKSLVSAFSLDVLLPAGVTYMAGLLEIDKAFLAGAAITIVRSALTTSMPAKHKDNPYSYALEARNI